MFAFSAHVLGFLVGPKISSHVHHHEWKSCKCSHFICAPCSVFFCCRVLSRVFLWAGLGSGSLACFFLPICHGLHLEVKELHEFYLVQDASVTRIRRRADSDRSDRCSRRSKGKPEETQRLPWYLRTKILRPLFLPPKSQPHEELRPSGKLGGPPILTHLIFVWVTQKLPPLKFAKARREMTGYPLKALAWDPLTRGRRSQRSKTPGRTLVRPWSRAPSIQSTFVCAFFRGFSTSNHNLTSP